MKYETFKCSIRSEFIPKVRTPAKPIKITGIRINPRAIEIPNVISNIPERLIIETKDNFNLVRKFELTFIQIVPTNENGADNKYPSGSRNTL
ncbi:hypothetical protein [uncultured Arcticibacterium sp.]|uniref:hypothetical protein n=1 Tax=uncultured Arcticibacterium sp. TaxID=2173042 RepID=UPI0030FCE2D0